MPKYIYVGGETKSEHLSDAADERLGVDMPDSTTAFGVKFIVGKPTDVTREQFPNQAAYDHAIRKLNGNQYFRPFAEDVAFEEIKDEDYKFRPGVAIEGVSEEFKREPPKPVTPKAPGRLHAGPHPKPAAE